ncbi:hypothetical protein MTR67_026233 [Solanum verrucosum]|uniref:Uncharacterized protein n=1 Tax=Solanum verrucosum TaxID=315347 RepID=A0AAF0R1A6_SOLVR|nr:hypothetical protein MTR67_026233 [Solanum verrucosum]
MISSPPLRF